MSTLVGDGMRGELEEGWLEVAALGTIGGAVNGAEMVSALCKLMECRGVPGQDHGMTGW